jgi:hypothetical protein
MTVRHRSNPLIQTFSSINQVSTKKQKINLELPIGCLRT